MSDPHIKTITGIDPDVKIKEELFVDEGLTAAEYEQKIPLSPNIKGEELDIKKEAFYEEDEDSATSNIITDDPEIDPDFTVTTASTAGRRRKCTSRVYSRTAYFGSDYFNIEKFIIEIEKRPALYDKQLPEFSNRHIKEKLWTEICEAVIVNWSKMNEDEKSKTGKELQKRWKNMRDSFRKELNTQKNQPSGSGHKLRRKYLFFDQLLFLLPTLEQRTTDSYYDSIIKNQKYNLEEVGEAESSSEKLDKSKRKRQDSSSKVSQGKKNSGKTNARKDSYEESLLQILQDIKNEEDDEDRHFLFSLLPSMKQLNQKNKLKLRMNILQCVQQALECCEDPVVHPSSCSTPFNVPHPPYPHQVAFPQTQHCEIQATHSQYGRNPTFVTQNSDCNGSYIPQFTTTNNARMPYTTPTVSPSSNHVLSPTDSTFSQSSEDYGNTH